jgi:nucleotide-binding universal stress UspA family protein
MDVPPEEPKERPMYKMILVPLDGSDTAALALTHAKALAQRFGSTLHLVRAVHTLGELSEVATPSLASSTAMSQDVVARQNAASEQAEARQYLDDVMKELQADGVRAETRVRAGRPAEQILDAARTAEADLLVLTAFGAGGAHTRAPGAIYGGVADEVLRESHVPVLLVRP